ncbi:unnamed protein product, partial [Didymodactylos carnosus]
VGRIRMNDPSAVGQHENDQEDYLNYAGEKSFYASEQSQQIEDEHEFVKRMLTQFRQHTTTQ